jgi:hypothetical protein
MWQLLLVRLVFQVSFSVDLEIYKFLAMFFFISRHIGKHFPRSTRYSERKSADPDFQLIWHDSKYSSGLLLSGLLLLKYQERLTLKFSFFDRSEV